MAIQCPRCRSPMETVASEPTESATESVPLDVCRVCRGLWIDGPELGDVSTSLAKIPSLHTEIVQYGRRTRTSISTCPRCRAHTLEFPFFEVRLDYCPDCHGIWLDGDEHEGLARAMDADEGKPVEEGTYRTVASSAVRKGSVPCARCKTEIALTSVFMTEDGGVCDQCFYANPPKDHRPTTDEEKEAATRDYGIAKSLGELGKALGIGLLALGTAQRCRCRYGSRCRC